MRLYEGLVLLKDLPNPSRLIRIYMNKRNKCREEFNTL